MRRVSRIITDDGVEHKDEAAALKYLEEQYQLILSGISHRLIHKVDKYSTMKLAIIDELGNLKKLITVDTEMRAEIVDT